MKRDPLSWLRHIESQVSASEAKRREAQENLSREVVSNCCGSNMESGIWLDIMMCPACGEHCGIDYVAKNFINGN